MTQKIKSWSFSRYNTYRQCPLKLKFNAIDRIREPSNAAMERGIEIHKKAEDYIKGNINRIPVELKQFTDEFKKLRAQHKKKISGMVVEDTWAFTKSWDETQWDDWVHCWLRVKLDCAHHEDDETLVVTDWKTGKFRQQKVDEYIEQLELYALAALLLHDHIQYVKPRLVFLDLGIVHPDEKVPIIFSRKDLKKLQKSWEKRVRPMMNDTRFAPRPSDECRWCFYRASNKANGGGQCRF